MKKLIVAAALLLLSLPIAAQNPGPTENDIAYVSDGGSGFTLWMDSLPGWSGTEPGYQMKKVQLWCGATPGPFAPCSPSSSGSGVPPSSGQTPAAGGNLASTATGDIQNLKRVSQLFLVGDSFARGTGVTDYSLSYAGLLAKDTPAPVYNAAVNATYSNQYVLQALNNFDPNPNLTAVSAVSGSENDGNNDACGGGLGTTCMKSFTLNEQELIGWLTIPMKDRMFTNNAACVKTGTWSVWAGTNDMHLPTYTWQASQAAGFAAEQATVTGATMTCTVTTPTSVTKLGLNYGVINTSTSSFTVSVDGTPVTDYCSGTTTFSVAPCATLPNFGTTIAGLYRQEFSVTPGTTHTVAITFTNGNSQAIFQSVDWIEPHSASNNVIFQFAQNQAWANYANYNTQMAAIYTAAQADGLPANFVDSANGVTYAGHTYLVNATTDISSTATATCSGANSANHPNTCGHEHYRETLEAAEYSAIAPDGTTGFVFSSPNLVSNQAVGDNAISNGPIMTKMPFSTVPSAASIVLTNANPFGAVHITGTTPITVLQPPPLCMANQLTACYVTLFFDTAGGSIAPFAAQPYNFTMGYTAPIAGGAITVVYDTVTQLWHPLLAFPQTVFTPSNAFTPNFNYAYGKFQTFTLVNNATAAVSGIVKGMEFHWDICENATGGWTFTFPASFHGVTPINTTANTCSDYIFDSFNGTDFHQVSSTAGITPTTITSGATPAISVAPLQAITLSADATPTITVALGEHLVLQICQPASGGPYHWTAPAALHGAITDSFIFAMAANTCAIQAFDSYNGTTLVAESTGVTSVAP